MAEYKGIKGFKVQYLDQDPVPTVAGWSSAPSLNSDHSYSQGIGTTTSDGQIAGGAPGGSTANELWNGTAWTTSTTVPSQSAIWGGSTQGSSTASFYVAGLIGPFSPSWTLSSATLEWNGASWTSSGSYPFNAWDIRASGTQTAGLAEGGIDGFTPTVSNLANIYDGSTWTGISNWPISKRNHIAFGTQTATLAGTGESPQVNTFTSWNGSSWSSEANYPVTLQAGTGSGVESAGIVTGGYDTAPLAATNTYDGTAWAAQGNLGTARASLSSIGSVSGAKAMSGVGAITSVEDYTGPGALVTKTITVS